MDLNFLKDKSVLVTGGTGSFGQKFVERLLNESGCKRVIVFSRDEFKQYGMQQRLGNPGNRLRFFLGDVRDLSRLQRAFRGVDIVVHAAALKQVPMLEFNPLEAVKTNVLGTQNVIDAALDNKVEKVVLVSTDKSVNPANLYGATKLCAEKLLVAANSYSGLEKKPIFSAVRYGNVLGSRGSIIEVLKNQKDGGEVTLTHPEMTRFWITLDQGVDLVLSALKLMRGGEIFVPKLPAMKVADLIAAIAPECKVRVIGIRPGEKMHEALLMDDEARRSRDIGKYYVVQPTHNWWDGSHLDEFPLLPDGFLHASNEVEELTKEELLDLIK